MATTAANERTRGGGGKGGEKELADLPKCRTSDALAGNPNEQSRAPRRIQSHLSTGRGVRALTGPGLGRPAPPSSPLDSASADGPSTWAFQGAHVTVRPVVGNWPTGPTIPPEPTLGQGSGSAADTGAGTSADQGGVAADDDATTAPPEATRDAQALYADTMPRCGARHDSPGLRAPRPPGANARRRPALSEPPSSSALATNSPTDGSTPPPRLSAPASSSSSEISPSLTSANAQNLFPDQPGDDAAPADAAEGELAGRPDARTTTQASETPLPTPSATSPPPSPSTLPDRSRAVGAIRG
nr:putative protein TPRXL [Aegilops tauschii subsp. strangulata]